MFGIGMPELLLVFVLALLVFGPKELPKIARTIGKAMAELRRASDDLRDGIQREIDLADREAEPPASPPPEATPSPRLAETTPPVPETQPRETTAGGPEVPTETTTLAPEERTDQTTNIAEAPKASTPPETGEAKGSPEAPAPPHPAETRNV